jgi:fatty-acid desaturase
MLEQSTTNDSTAQLSDQRPHGVTVIAWASLIPITLIHVTALTLAPLYFSWTGVVVGFISGYIIAPLGINLTYHRLLTHRSLAVPKWLERSLVVLALLSLEGPPMQWVATHRLHHRKSDSDGDPHSPRRGLFWAHLGWIFRPAHSPWITTTYARDIARDPFYRWLQGGWHWFSIYVAHAVLFWVVAVGSALLAGRDLSAAFALGASVLVWGVLVRQIYVWHITWCINSLTHVWGYRSYPTRDDSRNNWLLGVLGAGEGWHNNHHHDPASASNWHKPWELDGTYVLIRLLEVCGLATNVKRPRRERLRRDDADVQQSAA